VAAGDLLDEVRHGFVQQGVRAGIDPSPRRSGPTWSQFLKAHAHAILACDLFHLELIAVTRLYAFFVIDHANRQVPHPRRHRPPHRAVTGPASPKPDHQSRRHRKAVQVLIRDRDAKFTGIFDTDLDAAAVQILKTPIRAPRVNAIAERFLGSIRRELLDRILIVNQRHATAALAEYEHHFNHHRPHRGRSQAAPLRALPEERTTATTLVRRHDRIGGLLHEYQQVA